MKQTRQQHERAVKEHARALKGYLSFDDERVLLELAHGLFDAKRNNDEWPYNPLSIKEEKEYITSLRNGLVRLVSNKGRPEVALRMVDVAIKAIPDFHVEYLSTLDSEYLQESIKPENLGTIVFKEAAQKMRGMPLTTRTATAEKMLAITESVLSDINQPGKGGSRRDAKLFVRGIEILIKWFEEAQSTHSATAHEGSQFNSYVCYWMNKIMGCEIDEPERHIKNAIQFAKKWKKLSL